MADLPWKHHSYAADASDGSVLSAVMGDGSLADLVRVDRGAGHTEVRAVGASGEVRVKSPTGVNLARFGEAGALFGSVYVGNGGGGSTSNLAVGENALSANTTGVNSAAFGNLALRSATTGIRNTAAGVFTLRDMTVGDRNTAVGYSAHRANIDGSGNVAIGDAAMINCTSGDNNIAIGSSASPPSLTGSNQLVIGSYITGVDGVTMFGTTAPGNATAGGIRATGLSQIDGGLYLGTGAPPGTGAMLAISGSSSSGSRMSLVRTDTPPNQRRWDLQINGSGDLQVIARNDDASVQSTILFNRDGSISASNIP